MKARLFLPAAIASLTMPYLSYADEIIVAEPEPVEYLRICDTYGEGYFYIPGTQTCLRLSGYARADIKGGDDAYAYKGRKDNDSYFWLARGELRFETMSDTELGPLHTLIELRSQWEDGKSSESGQLRFGYIEWNGFRVGVDESIFWNWTGYLGKMINDSIVDPGMYKRTNVISYTFASATGISAIIGVEQGTNDGSDNGGYNYYLPDSGNRVGPDAGIALKGQPGVRRFYSGSKITDYTPNILLGAKYVQGWGSIAAIGVYDSQWDRWAGKVRINLDATDKLSLWLMGGYKSGDDYYAYDSVYTDRHRNRGHDYYYRMHRSQYADWGGNWAVWGGASYDFNQKTTFNTQLTFDSTSLFSASANMAYILVPGLSITPEFSYVNYGNNRKWADGARVTFHGEDSFQGAIRLQRDF